MSHSLLSTAVNILKWLEADAERPIQARIDRDRRIGKSLQADAPAANQVLKWWQAITADTPAADVPGTGERLVALISLATGILVLLGAVFGASVAGAIFGYQGDAPVNLFALLGVLVGLPLVLLIASLLLLKVRALIPAAIRDAMGVISPGRWMGSYLEKHTPVQLFETLSHRPIQGVFARWQLLAFGQSFAIGYFVGVLIIALLLVVFTDLAFGWSTTLETDPQFVWRLLHGMSLPWAAWLPAAAPDLALVESSRFYRLESGMVDARSAAVLGRWWPFVLMTIFVYGLLPRVIFATIANWQVSRVTGRLLAEGPQIAALLDRLRAPAVSFDGPDETEDTQTQSATALLAQLDLSGGSAVIIWNNVLSEQQVVGWLAARHGDKAQLVSAAEWQSQSDQRDQLRALQQSLPASLERLVILTKGWEPPLLAFSDYLALVRHVLGDNLVLVIVPLAINGAAITAQDQTVWARALAAREDPKLFVASAT